MIPFAESAARRLRQHPTDADLVLFLDQELSTKELARVRNHLVHCWSCRHRQEEIQLGIHRFVANRKRMCAASAVDQGEITARFLMRLSAEECRHAPTDAPYTLGPRLSWVGVAALFIFLCFWTVQRTMTPISVSASVLLKEAQAVEKLPPSPGASLDEEITLRIARREGDDWRTAFISGDDPALQAGELGVIAELEEALRHAGLQGDPRLSAAQFDVWTTALGAELSVQQVAREDGEYWRILAKPKRKERLPEMSLLIRGRDRVVCEYRISFLRSGKEVLYVLSPDRREGKLRIGSAPAPPQLTIPGSGSRSLAASHAGQLGVLSRTEADLAVMLTALSVEVHHVLHDDGLCLSGMVNLVREPGGIRVQGVVERPEDLERLRQQFLGQEAVRIDLRVLSEHMDSTPPPGVEILVAEPPPASGPEFRRQIYEQLVRTLAPDADEQEASRIVSRFGNEAIDSSRQALQHAWAFRRLRQEFLPSRVGLLPEEYRLLLEEIASDHLRGVEENLGGLASQLRPLISSPADADSAGETPLSITELPARIDHLALVLFAGLDSGGRTVAEVLRDLARSLPAGVETVAVHRASFFSLLQTPTVASSNSHSMERSKP